MRNRLATVLLVAGSMAMAGVGATEVWAAPQSVGLLAMSRPVPLRCEDGNCVANLSGFCLEPRRDNPLPTTPYELAGGSVTLVLTRADGSSVRLPAEGRVRFAAEREYTAIKARINDKLLADHAAVSAAIEIGPRVTLIPETDRDDPTAHSREDIAFATGRLRPLAETIFEIPSIETDTVRLTAALIQALPWRAISDPAVRRSLWRRVVVERGLEGVFSAAGADRARKVFRRCVRRAEYGYITPLRRCLELEHDALIAGMMKRYKAALGTS